MKTIIYLIIAIFLVNITLAQVEVRYLGVCKGNGICENKENYQNCPQDCFSGQKDNYCDSISDNICDPDCPSQADPDCEPTVTSWQKIVYAIKKPFIDIKSLRPAMQRAYYIIIAGSAVIIVAIMILLIISAHKINMYRKQRPVQEIKGVKMPTSKPPKIKELLKPEKKPIKLSLEMQKYYNVLEKPVKRLISAGYKKEEIKTRLEKEKWPKEVLDTLFKKL
ncbi:hypothetical protein KY331_04370 [Candidatus Woesearchaeota archaeon]|nr:hypothetical protein [Candidatus Woesearchaeota archaeon]